jgi:VWFA-related protein
MLAALMVVAMPIAAQEVYVETIEVRVVNVDVVVTDRAGVPIPDLEVEDFELYVGGRRVDVSYFSRIAEGRLDEGLSAEERTDAVAEEGTAPGVDLSPRAPVTWALFIDQTNMAPGRRNEALAQLRTFLVRAMEEGDRGMIALYDGQAFRMKRNVTGDRRLVSDTLQALERERFNPGPAFTEKVMLRVRIQGADEWDVGAVKDAVWALVEAEAARTRNAINAMGTFVDALAGIEGRLAMVYLGAGFNTLPGMEIVQVLRQRFPYMEREGDAPRPEDHKVTLEAQVSRLFDRISATRATLYTIHAGDPGGPTAADDPGDTVMERGMQADSERLTEAGIARELAERTGGSYFKSGQWLDRQLDSVRADLSQYYSLGYSPDGPAGRSEKVRVVVKVAGARVRHRETVRERTPKEQAQDAVVAALFDSALTNPLEVTVELGAPQRASSGSGRTVPVRVIVPVQALSFIPDGEMHRGGLSFYFAIAANDGTLWRLESRELPLEFTRGEFATALGQTIAYSVEIPLQAPEMRIAVSVQDRTALVRSTILVPFEARSRGRDSRSSD